MILAMDGSGRNICVHSIITNVYIKIPDDNVTIQNILSEVALKISCEGGEMTLLDSKFAPLTDDEDKGQSA